MLTQGGSSPGQLLGKNSGIEGGKLLEGEPSRHVEPGKTDLKAEGTKEQAVSQIDLDHRRHIWRNSTLE